MIMIDDRTMLFALGQVVATRGAIEHLAPDEVQSALGRHVKGDWGLVCEEDRLENEFSLEHHFRLMSVYEDSKGKRFWIITEADRSATTVLLPEEY